MSVVRKKRFLHKVIINMVLEYMSVGDLMVCEIEFHSLIVESCLACTVCVHARQKTVIKFREPSDVSICKSFSDKAIYMCSITKYFIYHN